MMKILLSVGFMFLILVAGLSLPVLWDRGAASIPPPKRVADADPVYDIQIHPDEKRALIRTLHGVSVRDLFTGELLHNLSTEPFQFTTVIWVPGTEQVLIGCRDGRVMHLEDYSACRDRFSAAVHKSAVLSAAVSASGRFAVTASEDCLCIWQLEEGRLQAKFPLDGAVPCRLAFFPDRRRILLGTRDGCLRILERHDGRLVDSFRPSGEQLVGARLIENGQKILAVYDNAIFSLDITTGEAREIPASCRGGSFVGVDVSPDGTLFACTDFSKDISLYSLETGQKIAMLPGHSKRASIVTFSDSERWLYSGGCDGIFRIWDLKTHTEISAHSVSQSR